MTGIFGIDVIYLSEKGKIHIEANYLKLTTASHNKDIIIKEVSTLQTKDGLNNNYLLRILTKEEYILTFKNAQIRDFFKSLIFFKQQKYKENKEQNESKKTSISESKIILTTHIELESLENTKSSLVEFLSYNPVLLAIFDEMNCSLHQFYNYLKSSFFYNIKNEKNVIDRLLNEKLRDFKIKENNFATRINNFSFMNIMTKETDKESNIVKSAKNDVEFHPLYITKKSVVREKKNDFSFPNQINLNCETRFIQTKNKIVREYDKKILNKLVESCKMAYLSRKNCENSQNMREKALKIEEEYKDILKDENLESFRPSKYL